MTQFDVRTRPWLRQPGETEHEFSERRCDENQARIQANCDAIEARRAAGTLVKSEFRESALERFPRW